MALSQGNKITYVNMQVINTGTVPQVAKHTLTVNNPIIKDAEDEQYSLAVVRFSIPLNGIPLAKKFPFHKWLIGLFYTDGSGVMQLLPKYVDQPNQDIVSTTGIAVLPNGQLQAGSFVPQPPLHGLYWSPLDGFVPNKLGVPGSVYLCRSDHYVAACYLNTNTIDIYRFDDMFGAVFNTELTLPNVVEYHSNIAVSQAVLYSATFDPDTDDLWVALYKNDPLSTAPLCIVQYQFGSTGWTLVPGSDSNAYYTSGSITATPQHVNIAFCGGKLYVAEGTHSRIIYQFTPGATKTFTNFFIVPSSYYAPMSLCNTKVNGAEKISVLLQFDPDMYKSDLLICGPQFGSTSNFVLIRKTDGESYSFFGYDGAGTVHVTPKSNPIVMFSQSTAPMVFFNQATYPNITTDAVLYGAGTNVTAGYNPIIVIANSSPNYTLLFTDYERNVLWGVDLVNRRVAFCNITSRVIKNVETVTAHWVPVINNVDSTWLNNITQSMRTFDISAKYGTLALQQTAYTGKMSVTKLPDITLAQLNILTGAGLVSGVDTLSAYSVNRSYSNDTLIYSMPTISEITPSAFAQTNLCQFLGNNLKIGVNDNWLSLGQWANRIAHQVTLSGTTMNPRFPLVSLAGPLGHWMVTVSEDSTNPVLDNAFIIVDTRLFCESNGSSGVHTVLFTSIIGLYITPATGVACMTTYGMYPGKQRGCFIWYGSISDGVNPTYMGFLALKLDVDGSGVYTVGPDPAFEGYIPGAVLSMGIIADSLPTFVNRQMRAWRHDIKYDSGGATLSMVITAFNASTDPNGTVLSPTMMVTSYVTPANYTPWNYPQFFGKLYTDHFLRDICLTHLRATYELNGNSDDTLNAFFIATAFDQKTELYLDCWCPSNEVNNVYAQIAIIGKLPTVADWEYMWVEYCSQSAQNSDDTFAVVWKDNTTGAYWIRFFWLDSSTFYTGSEFNPETFQPQAYFLGDVPAPAGLHPDMLFGNGPYSSGLLSTLIINHENIFADQVYSMMYEGTFPFTGNRTALTGMPNGSQYVGPLAVSRNATGSDVRLWVTWQPEPGFDGSVFLAKFESDVDGSWPSTWPVATDPYVSDVLRNCASVQHVASSIPPLPVNGAIQTIATFDPTTGQLISQAPVASSLTVTQLGYMTGGITTACCSNSNRILEVQSSTGNGSVLGTILNFQPQSYVGSPLGDGDGGPLDIFSYQTYLNQINAAFQVAYVEILALAGSTFPVCAAPFITYNASTQMFTLAVPKELMAAAPACGILLNDNMQFVFRFPLHSIAPILKAGFTFYEVQLDYHQAAVASGYGTQQYINIMQEGRSLSQLNEIQRVQLQTHIPVNGDLIDGNSYIPAITDVVPDTDLLAINERLVFQPFFYKVYAMKATGALYEMDIEIWYQDKFGVSYPVNIYPGEHFSVKLGIIQKF